MRFLYLCVACLVFLLLAPSWKVHAQVGQAAAVFLMIDADARSRALGETGVLLRGSPGVAMLNPAAIGRRGQAQVRGGSSEWLPVFGADLRLNNVAAD